MQVSHHNKKLSNYSGFVSFPHILDLEKYNFTKSDLIQCLQKRYRLIWGGWGTSSTLISTKTKH